MLTQITPVVKGIACNLLGIGFVRLDPAQGIVSEILDEFGIDGTDEQIGCGKPLEHRLVVTPCMLHDDARICVQCAYKGNEFLDTTLGVAHQEGAGKEFASRLECGNHAFALGDINTDSVHKNPSKQ